MLYSTLIEPTATRGPLAVKKKNLISGTEGADDAIYTLTLPEDGDPVFSMLETGVDWKQTAGTAGPFERCTISGNAATFRPQPAKVYTRFFAIVGGL